MAVGILWSMFSCALPCLWHLLLRQAQYICNAIFWLECYDQATKYKASECLYAALAVHVQADCLVPVHT